MANEDLQNFANDLRSFGDLWDDLADVINSMKSDFSQSDRDAFKSCVEDDGQSYDSLSECLTEKAAEIGVAEEFRRRLNREDELISKLRSQGRKAAADNNVSQAVRDTINGAKISDLNKACSNYAFDYVEDELDLDDDAMQAALGFDSIENYTQCVSAAAEAAGLSDDLKDAYGTA